MREVIQIEIMKSEWKPNTWCIRIGDIKGSTEFSNIPESGLIEEIKEEIKELKDRDIEVAKGEPSTKDKIKKELDKDYEN